PFEPQRVFAQCPHDKAGRKHRAEEYQGHHDWVHHFVQQETELKPHPIEWSQRGWKEASKNEKQRCQRTSPGPRVSGTPEINHRKKNGNAKRAGITAQFDVARSLDNLLPSGCGGWASVFPCDVRPARSPRFKRQSCFSFWPQQRFRFFAGLVFLHAKPRSCK